MKKVDVVAAAIFSSCGEQLFIARRADNVHQGGLWEFPGGKKEKGETPGEALYRELNEELGIEVLQYDSLIKLQHDYGDKIVELDVYRVTDFLGQAHGAEGQETQWIELKELESFSFPEANKPIIKALLERS